MTNSCRTLFLACLLGGLTRAPANDFPAAPGYIIDHRQSPHAVLRPVPFDAVEWTDGFWADRYRQLSAVTLDESWRLMADPAAGHVLENFRLAALPGSGGYAGTTWQDEWLYKWIEAAACVWRHSRDPKLAQRMDEAMALIAAAQQPDGYLSTMPIVTGNARFQKPHDHEIYNMGHLLTAGVIHHRMTGSVALLNVARKTGDFLAANLGVTVEPYMAHNPSAVMGLIELHRVTGEHKYLAAAQLIVDRRGARTKRPAPAPVPAALSQRPIYGTDLIQDRVPIRDSHEVVGHNVFFTYLYTGAADVWAETGEPRLGQALGRLWADLTGRKMFINGGVSAIPRGISNNAFVNEAAGASFQLPNASCYNETCGQIGVFMWAHRMLASQPDAQFADVMEREMFNGFLPSVGLDGRSWFYRAVLRRYDADYQSTGWTDMVSRGQPGRTNICCPSNLLRTLAQLSAYFYSLDERGVWVHHYGGNKVRVALPGDGRFAAEQVTAYPWAGDIKLVVAEAPARPLALRLRVPSWAATSRLEVNGAVVEGKRVAGGYLEIERAWSARDTVTLSLPMEAQLMAADPRVEETRNQVAVVRGPVVYCTESTDLAAGMDVASVFIPSNARFAPVEGLRGTSEALGRTVITLRGTALHRSEPRAGPLYRPLSREPFQPFELTLIPYFAWANRGASAMSVWMPVIHTP
jgi:DUF1680 family protein